MSRNYSLEANLNKTTDFIRISGFSGILLSSFLLLSPAKSVGYIGVGAGLSAVGVSILGRNGYVKAVENHINELKAAKDSELKEKNEQIYTFEGEIKQLKTQIKTLNLDQELQVNEKIRLESELKEVREQINNLSNQYDYFKKNWEAYTQQLENSISNAKQAVSEAIEEWQKKITLLASTKTDYSKLAERLIELLKEGQDILDCYRQKLEEAKTKFNSLDDLLSIYFCLNDEMVGIKTRMIKSINTLSVQEKELDLDESYGSYESLKEKYINLQKQYNQTVKEANAELMRLKGDCDSRIQEFLVVAEKEVDKTWGENEEFFKQLKETIQALEKQVSLLSKPLEYRPAIRADMVIGNVLIRYFHALGVILDRSHSVFEGYQATLWFFVDRNARIPLASELNEHSERLQALAHSLNSPQFELDPESGLIKVAVQWAKKPKADIKDIDRLWIPASQFEQTVKGWARIRLTGGSESGKSPTAENLAVAILKHRPGIPKLYNPQFDSVKNHWSIPVTGTSHGDSEKGIASLAKQVDARANGQESKEVFELSIFDEVDSTMSHTKGKKSVIGGNVNFIIKQASHQNLGAIFIGQNANVSEYPGMDRSDWNSAVNVHIGANAYDAITNSNRFTHDEVTKLKQTADKITEFCHDKNTELGLEKTDPNAYRFALVIEPNKKPYFIELPAFGTYTFDQLQQHQHATPELVTATPDNTTQSLDPLKTRNSTVSPMDIQSGYVGSGCPGCGSANRVKAGKYQQRQRYQCKDCGKRYTEGDN